MNENLFDLLNSSPEEVFYNCRVKHKRLADGSFVPVEVMVCDRFIFNPNGCKPSELQRARENRAAYEEAARELFLGELPRGGSYVPEKTSEEEKTARSKRRAKSKLFDIILANDFDCFVTLTLNGDKIDRKDYGAVIKKLNTWLDNRVRRCGLRYCGVAEKHKKGGIHFHLLCNAAALGLVDSGTVSVPEHKKPIKVATADRLHIPVDVRKTVYNVPNWKLGFSTAVMTYGDVAAVANYVGKYITKGEEKIGGRWYYSGGKLERLHCSYERVSFNDFDGATYEFECDGGRFKVVKFT